MSLIDMRISPPLPEPHSDKSGSDVLGSQPGEDLLAPPEVLLGVVPLAGTPGSFDRLLARVAGTIGLDRAIVFTILARGWSSLAGLGTLLLIAHSLSPAEQGYYYTFYSMVALQIVFELGFSVVILQTASHEIAHLTVAADGSLGGPLRTRARLASVLQKSIRWYGIAGALMALVVLPVGMLFFGTQRAQSAGAPPVAWLMPWVLVVLATVCTFQIDPIFSFIEGCGFVSQVARTRFVQAVVGTSLGWIALLTHHGLLAPGLVILGQALAGAWFVVGRRRLLLPLLRQEPGEDRIHWGSEVWPFQWRIAVSWICGYMIFQLFNPIIFHYRGPVEAGRMGMSVSICGTIQSMAIAWMSTKASPFGQMIARGEYERLDGIFFKTLIQSAGAAILAFVVVLSLVIELQSHQVKYALRLLPPLPLGLLMATTVINVVVFAEALYLRAHKQEKFMVNALLGALCMAPASIIFGCYYGAPGVSAAYFLTGLFVGLGHGTYTFFKWRRLWHEA